MTTPPSYPFQGRVGEQSASDGSYQPFRVGRKGEIITGDTHGKYYESVRLGRVYSLIVGPTTTGIAAGHITAATAAAAVQIALINPASSGYNFSLLQFGFGVTSGTFPAGPVVHGSVAGCTLTTSVTTNGTAKNNLLGGPGGSAVTVAVAASTGSALTGGAAVANVAISQWASTATAQASVGVVNAKEDVNGVIVIPPGYAWVPVFSGAGTSVLSWLSCTWEEIPA